MGGSAGLCVGDAVICVDLRAVCVSLRTEGATIVPHGIIGQQSLPVAPKAASSHWTAGERWVQTERGHMAHYAADARIGHAGDGRQVLHARCVAR